MKARTYRSAARPFAGATPGTCENPTTGNKVFILSNGTWHAAGPVIYRHPCGRTEPVRIGMNFFLVESDGRRILVDTGIDHLERFIDERLRVPLALTPSVSTLSELHRIGVAPDEIDTVVLTHLHFDHCENIALFPRARIILNELEWGYVTSRDHGAFVSRDAFPRSVLAYLVDEAWDRLELVNGSFELAPGIRVMWTGGHTPGHQMVTVETTAGLVILVGDEIATYDNMECNIPIGTFNSFDNLVNALKLVRTLDGIVIPVHEPRVLERHPAGVVPSPRKRPIRLAKPRPTHRRT